VAKTITKAYRLAPSTLGLIEELRDRILGSLGRKPTATDVIRLAIFKLAEAEGLGASATDGKKKSQKKSPKSY
jgi:hypothetical protein